MSPIALTSDNVSDVSQQLKDNAAKTEKVKELKEVYDFDSMFSKDKGRKSAKKEDSIDVSQFSQDAEDEYSQVKTDYFYKHEYVPPERLNEGVVMANCFAIENNEDLKRDCLAIAKGDDNWCFAIESKNMRNSCLGQVKNNANYCFSVEDQDMRNACLASAKGDSQYCFAVDNQDIRNSCLAQTIHGRDQCFAIDNTNIRNACLAITSKK